MGLIQFIKDLNRTKGGVRKNLLFLSTGLELGHQSPLGFRTRLGFYTINFPGSQAFGLQTLGLGLHSCISQFLKINNK